MKIPFNQVHFFGDEQQHITQVIKSGDVAGNGLFTHKCHQFFKDYYSIEHCLLTNSCTAALEMAAILLDVQPGDEIIMPAYGYVSTANAFVLRGAKLVFIDSMNDSPNMDVELLEGLITEKTKAIVVMHYGGIAVDMDIVMSLADDHSIFVIEDAAHGVDAYYKGRPLGTIGHLGTLSFHTTKNITSGHGGLLIVNDEALIDRSNVIWQKGTDKTKFDLGHQGYYQWIDIGSSFFPSEITAAYLYGQLMHLEDVTKKRRSLWHYYMSSLLQNKEIYLPVISQHTVHNGHIFYIETKSVEERKLIINKLKQKKINAYSHYLSLSESPFYEKSVIFNQSRKWQDILLRLPMYYSLSFDDIDFIVQSLSEK